MTPHGFATARATRHHGQKPVRQTLSEYLRVLPRPVLSFVQSVPSTAGAASSTTAVTAAIAQGRRASSARRQRRLIGRDRTPPSDPIERVAG